MKRYKVVCIGYKNPDVEKVKELVAFEDFWLESRKLGRRILIHPGVCIRETENYNEGVLNELEKKKYNEYNLSGHDLGTIYDFNARHEFNITI